MKKILFIGALLCVAHTFTFAQFRNSVSGYVTDQSTGRVLNGVQFQVLDKPYSTFSNEAGYFTISCPSTPVIISCSQDGYQDFTIYLKVSNDTSINVALKPKREYIETIYTTSSNIKSPFINPINAVLDVPIKTLKGAPLLFSENDLNKGLQLFPGIDFGGHGHSDLIVRGGDVSQNLVLLDGVPIYGNGHFFGYMSNFNTDAISSTQVYKGNAPARFGGRASSVIDIKTNSGDTDDAHAALHINPILANLNVTMPMDRKNSMLSFNIRRSYIDVLLGGLQENTVVFGDFHSKLKLNLGKNDQLIFGVYSLGDKYNLSFEPDSGSSASYEIGVKETNRVFSTRFNHVFSSKLYSSFSAYYSAFKFAQSLTETDTDPLPGVPSRIENELDIGLNHIGIHADLEYARSNNHFFLFGLHSGLRNFNTGSLKIDNFNATASLLSSEQYGDTSSKKSLEIAPYFEDEWQINPLLSVNLGARLVVYNYNGYTNVLPEPRISAVRVIDSVASVKFSCALSNQFLHLYLNGSPNTTSAWLPATELLKPESSTQLNVGYVRKFTEKLTLESDVYFKQMNNLVLFYNTNFLRNQSPETNAIVGEGRSVGFENILKYKSASTQFWLGYTLSKFDRTFEGINDAETFDFDYNRLHNLKTTLIYHFERFVLSTNLVVASGNPFTLPNAKYRDINGRVVLSYDEINNYQSAPYFRSDIKIQYFVGDYYSDFTQSVELTLYNISANQNVSEIYSQLDKSRPNQAYQAVKVSNFYFFPSASYRLIF